VLQQVDLYFGYANEMLEFNLNDEYIWRSEKAARNGGKPENGNIDGEGYVECGICGKDFFVNVVVRNDIIKTVRIDSKKKGYMPRFRGSYGR
jgi:hypothetical protein